VRRHHSRDGLADRLRAFQRADVLWRLLTSEDLDAPIGDEDLAHG
jgi:hypothetical protein